VTSPRSAWWACVGISVFNHAGKVRTVTSLDIARYKEVVGHYVTGVVVIGARPVMVPWASPVKPSARYRLTLCSCPSPRGPRVVLAARENRRDRGHQHPFLRTRSTGPCLWTSGIDKFEDVDWSPGPSGSPLLKGALAHLEGTVVAVSTHGDHDIVVVGVEYAISHPGTPLIYYRVDSVSSISSAGFTTIRA